MKQLLAKYSNSVLVVVAAGFVFTASYLYVHAPSTPAELLKK
jgi:cyclic lactone autoinducer peptide